MLERPNTQFQIYRSPTVGDNQAGGISAMQLPGSRVRGVIVDNPSGSWVKLSGTGLGFEPYIAPYTLAWSVSVLPSVLEIAAAYVAGPIGQPSTTAGAPIVVYLFEAQVPSSGGSTFVNAVPETTPFNSEFAITVAGASLGTLVTPMATQRIRLFLLAATLSSAFAGVGLVADSGAIIDFTTTPRVTRLNVAPDKPSDIRSYPGGLDLPVGVALAASGQALWGRTNVTVELLYAFV